MSRRVLFLFMFLEFIRGISLVPFDHAVQQGRGGIEVRNGHFAEWENGKPAGWIVQTGATDGSDSPKSIVRKGQGASLELSGDASTEVWQVVSQSFRVQPGETIRLSYSAEATGIQRDPGQRNNCHVGLFFKNGNGQKLPPVIWPVATGEHPDHVRIVRMPEGAASFDLAIFLSQTGKLNVSNFGITVLEPGDSFETLVADMARHYSFFELKNIDWITLTSRYRDQTMGARNADEFCREIVKMLSELQDLHVWLIIKGKQIPAFVPPVIPGNYDLAIVDRGLKMVQRAGRLGVAGLTEDGCLYLRIESLEGIAAREIDAMIGKIVEHIEVPALIVDLRVNRGGSEEVAQAIAGMFIEEAVVYARQKFRNGIAAEDFTDESSRVLLPTGKRSYRGKVICLIGPHTVSSGEGMAMMMQAVPNCILIGQPTRGASGNPQPVQLPNGVDVWYSRWVAMLPDGTPLEGIGVRPQVLVDHVSGADRTFEKGKEMAGN